MQKTCNGESYVLPQRKFIVLNPALCFGLQSKTNQKINTLKSSILKSENVKHGYALQEHNQLTVSYIKIHWKLALCLLLSPMLHAFNLLLCLLKAIKVIAIPCIMIIAVFHSLCLSAQTPRKDSGVNGQIKYELVGQVLSAIDNSQMQGVSIRIEEENIQVKSSKDGTFKMLVNNQKGKMKFSFVGFKSQEINYTAGVLLTVKLIPEDNQLEEVEVVSTGYQKIPKERATGSFVYVDEKTLQRNPAMKLISRLDGVTNGLLLDKSAGNPDGLSVRGRSTLFSNTKPLIVLDNFPFDGDLDNINPNDIESVTILKDGAAAAIWGVRSGNGVIVVTTKKGKSKLTIDFSSNFLIGKKPDLFYQKQMSSSDFIDSEISLFKQGYYDKDINTPYKNISPVVHILSQVRLNELPKERADEVINSLRNHDVRNEIHRYFHRNKIQSQQQFRISAGSDKNKNILSVGYDRSLSESVSADNNRLSIRNNSQWNFFRDYIQLNADLWYVKNINKDKNAYGYNPLYPYEKLVENGNALEASTLNTLRRSYTDTVGDGYLSDWKFRPIEEVRNGLTNYSARDQQLRFQFGISSKLFRSFKIAADYLMSNNWIDNSTLYDQNSFFSRNLINQYSQVDLANGIVTRPVPLGDILNSSQAKTESQYGRIQLDWREHIGTSHLFSGIMGMEWRKDKNLFQSAGNLYGYNRNLESFTEVDIFSFFPIYHSGGYSMISKGGGRAREVDNNRSLYGLFSYSYKDNFTLTGSIRKDESNIFGVSANQKGVPLWSVGVLYSFQDLLKWDKLDYLKLRTTYGYNGNVDKTTTAYLTSKLYRTTNLWGKPMDIILNPPNSSLRWERVENQNIGVDFSFMKSRFGGSIDYFKKNGKDLMGRSPVAPQVGVEDFYGNVASTSTHGLDAQIWFSWFRGKAISVRSDFIFNKVKDKVTNYYLTPGANNDIVSSTGVVPLKGYPINALVLYKFYGLDELGNPLGFANNEITDDYSTIINGSNKESIVIIGSRMPTKFGSLRHTILYKKWEMSFNFTYKLGYYLKRNDSFNSNGLLGGGFRYSDYDKRWQHKGDEAFTTVPSFVYPANINRESFYQNSSALFIEGDHIRLQDIRCSYKFSPLAQLPNSVLEFYMYCSNIGLLWKANDQRLDPMSLTGYPTPLEVSAGVKFNF